MKPILFFCISLLYFVGCASQNKDATYQQSDTIDIVQKNELNNLGETHYKLPSPVELYILIKKAGALFNENSLHKSSLLQNYNTSDKKAYNFGIYASDLAYCTVFEKNQESHVLFKTIKIMASDLGFSEGFSTEILTRIDKNLYNSDSLYQITNESYWEVCKSLEESGNATILSKILLGAWVESLYISVKSVEKFDPQSELLLRITEQSLLLENLIDYSTKLTKDSSNNMILQKLLDLQYSFDKLYDNPKNIVITADQFNEISQKITRFRSDLIQ